MKVIEALCRAPMRTEALYRASMSIEALRRASMLIDAMLVDDRGKKRPLSSSSSAPPPHASWGHCP